MYGIYYNTSSMYKEAQRHRAVLPAIARHLLYCTALQLFMSMRWVRFHSPPCASMRRHSSSRWRESSSEASCSLQLNVSASWLWRPLLLLHVLSLSCSSMRRRARPCASIRVHAVQCAPMCLLVGPVPNPNHTSYLACLKCEGRDRYDRTLKG